jgi:hypothetical protein
MDKPNIKTNYRQALEEKHINAEKLIKRNKQTNEVIIIIIPLTQI